jgi:glycosyltransferase involved in cell wall biosynthesis
MRFERDCLMVIIPDKLSVLLAKGESVPRYYNPGEVFREVHLVMIADDAPDPAAAQQLVGEAKLFLHAFPAGKRIFLASAGWRPRLLRRWAAPLVALAARIKPQLVRVYGNHLNGFAASEIKRRLDIPYIVSLHGNPDIDYFRGRRATSWQRRLLGRAIEAVEIITVTNADFVLPVYSPVLPYLRKHGISRYEVVYNAVGYGVRDKTDYAIDPSHVRALCVGRQQSQEKDASHILEAVADLPEIHLTLVGDGDLHQDLVAKADALGIAARVAFERALPNERVLALLAEADFLVYASQNYEISKVCIEAALTGLPAVLNDRGGDPAEELKGGHFLLIPDTREAYRDAMRRLIDDDDFRARLGRTARAHAMKHWQPEKMEARVALIYRRVARAPAPQPAFGPG